MISKQTYAKMPRLFGGIALALTIAAGTPSTAAAGEIYNAQGWTVLTPAPDTRLVFVSSTDGDDRNSGRSPANAVKTLAKAESLMRDNSADWMLLKRGDTWNEGFGSWKLSGRSEEERIVLASYGEGDTRPRLLLDGTTGISAPYAQDVSHVAIVGLRFEAVRNNGESSRGIRWLSSGDDLLVEDCYLGGFKDNITIEGQGDGFENVSLRRNVVVDSWSVGGHSQGIFLNNVTGATLLENVIDHNGWNPDVPGAESTVFNQNVYIQAGVTGVQFTGNITARSAAAGAQIRSGGLATDNLFYANPMAMRFGYASLDWPEEFATGSVFRNVVIGGVTSSDTAEPFGLWIERVKNTLVAENIVAHARGGTNPIAITLGAHARDVEYRNNVTYNWVHAGRGIALKTSARGEGSVTFRENSWVMPGSGKILSIRYSDAMSFSDNTISGVDPEDSSFSVVGRNLDFDEWSAQNMVDSDAISSVSFADEGRDLDAYARHLGLTDAESFLQAARGQSRLNWDPRLTGSAATEWIRAGYERVD